MKRLFHGIRTYAMERDWTKDGENRRALVGFDVYRRLIDQALSAQTLVDEVHVELHLRFMVFVSPHCWFS